MGHASAFLIKGLDNNGSNHSYAAGIEGPSHGAR
jgi:hypothetical protein